VYLTWWALVLAQWWQTVLVLLWVLGLLSVLAQLMLLVWASGLG
jgi:hypothetical protein